MIGVLLAFSAGVGAYLLYTALVYGWRGAAPGWRVPLQRRWLRDWLVQAGVDRPGELAAVGAVLALLGAALGYGLFAGVAPAVVLGGAGAAAPVLAARGRRRRRLEQAREAWPRLIEEIRLEATSLGRSIPQALFSIGRRAPTELRPAFAVAEREWLRSTDLDRALGLLKARLADPTADVVCETLLVAAEVGGAGVDGRLRDLAEDRATDLMARKDARARQAGARFARWFVLVVPLGMAVVGLSIGEGRAAYRTAGGQVAVVVALAMIAACWVWAGRLMRLPDTERVFRGEGEAR